MTDEKQQTPLHKAIALIKESEMYPSEDSCKCIDILIELLSEEKQMIIDAHKDGMETVSCLPEYSEQYFNETFKQ
jgi:hypothetical protein